MLWVWGLEQIFFYFKHDKIITSFCGYLSRCHDHMAFVVSHIVVVLVNRVLSEGSVKWLHVRRCNYPKKLVMIAKISHEYKFESLKMCFCLIRKSIQANSFMIYHMIIFFSKVTFLVVFFF